MFTMSEENVTLMILLEPTIWRRLLGVKAKQKKAEPKDRKRVESYSIIWDPWIQLFLKAHPRLFSYVSHHEIYF